MFFGTFNWSVMPLVIYTLITLEVLCSPIWNSKQSMFILNYFNTTGEAGSCFTKYQVFFFLSSPVISFSIIFLYYFSYCRETCCLWFFFQPLSQRGIIQFAWLFSPATPWSIHILPCVHIHSSILPHAFL